MKEIKIVVLAAVFASLLFTGCSSGSDDGETSNKISGINFDLTNAKALASVDNSESSNRLLSNLRGAEDEKETSPLLKILDDGNFDTAVSLSNENIKLANVKYICKSSTEDTYVFFDKPIQWLDNNESNYLGFLIRIDKNNNIYDFLRKGEVSADNLWNSYYIPYSQGGTSFGSELYYQYVFDKNGNLFILIQTGSGLAIF